MLRIIKNITTIITSIITILTFKVNDVFVAWIQENPKFTLSVIVLLVVTIGVLVLFFRDDYERPFKHNLNKTKIKHSILIFDDKSICIKEIMNVLAGYHFDTVYVRDISDYRLAENFDIIIGDIYGVGATMANNSIAVLNSIKEKYPYKTVIAMSNMGRDKSLLVDDFVSKENRDEYPKEILEKIKEYSKKMDNINDHWKATEIKLNEKGLKPEQIKQFKNEYFKSIKIEQ